ncbi:RC-LH1 core complex protein PufX [Sulfitobacter aestuariivivens]|uniref:RC-LH1 core complex protein PufX n=1 Tax=Sulfitobacter aestuariivivens TaxID=2766981 RepID=A0A927HEQ7_9RHOB|nr:RC-LH1 core complex protein PufX [Sulfitobacter aestuariivivens]MBD3665047.1 RC-LH1 core complex protein PufX [Sulfitobacter aestuariivivens]
MTDNNDYLRTGDPKFRLSADITMLMLKGAAYAAVFCLALWFCIWALYAIGLLLPEESRDTEDPTPFSYVIPAETGTQLL